MSPKSSCEFDFVIVGAGSAGCVLASRLATRGTVLLVEAGGDTRHPHMVRPAEYLKRFATADDWNFVSERQSQLAGRVLRLPRGRGLGGSTRINASIWMEPTADCLAALEAEGGGRWSSETMRVALAAVTERVAPEPARWLSPAADRFLEAAREAGFAPIVHARMNTRGRRVTAADAWLADPPSRLARKTNARVRSILLRDNRAVGIVVDTSQGVEMIHANRDVILCSGASQTAGLLMHSGIGPAEVLRKAGVECQLDSPGVGQGLQDHLIMPVIFDLPTGAGFPAAWSARDLTRWQAIGRGPVASNLAECGLFSGDAADRLQFHMTPTDYLRHPAATAPPAMTIGVTVSRPRSRGRIWIESADPQQPPQIDPAYLSDPHDMELLQEGIAIARRIAASEPLGSWIGAERMPGASKQTPDALARSVQRFSQTLYHLAGSCRMGRDEDAVVDPELRVRGMAGLRILDASILSGVPVANPNPLVMAMAWAGSEWIGE